MTHQGPIGEITEKSEQVVHWKIDNIFSLTETGEDYLSPVFKALNSRWCLEIRTNAETSPDCGWISLFLHLEGPSSNQGATYNFGVKKSDGEVEKKRSILSWIFQRGHGYGCPIFLKRTELVERKTELAPSDSLTVTCTLWGYDDFDSTAKTNSLSNHLLELFTSQKACDVILQVKQKRFSAHRAILTARSPVFAAMFETLMEERTTVEVHIDECDPRVFRDFLVYLYSGRLENLSRHMFELYEIADKYDVENLKADCIIAMMGNLSVNNVTDTAVFADKFQVHGLGVKVREFFNENYFEIFRTSKWVTLLKQKPKFANGLLKNMADYLAREDGRL